MGVLRDKFAMMMIIVILLKPAMGIFVCHISRVIRCVNAI